MTTLILFKSYFFGNAIISKGMFKKLRDEDRLWLMPLTILGILPVIGLFVYNFYKTFQYFFYIGVAIGRPDLPIFFASIISFIFLFLTIVPMIMSVLYYSNDTKLLMSLPVQISDIVRSKMLLLYVYSLPLFLMIYIPLIIIWFKFTSITITAVVSSAIQIIITPLFPLLFSIFFVAILMRISSIGKYKVVFEVFGMMMAIVLIIGAQILFSSDLTDSMNHNDSSEIIQNFSLLINKVTGYLFLFDWQAKSYILENGIVYSLITTVVATFIFYFLPCIIQNLYSIGVQKTHEVRKSGKRDVGVGFFKKRSIFGVILYKEWKILTSNSAFIINTFFITLIIPILIIFQIFTTKGLIYSIAEEFAGQPGFIFFLCGGIALLLGVNPVASTSLSREGKCFAVSLILPLKGKDHMHGKLALILLIQISSLLIGLISLKIIFPIGVLDMFLITILLSIYCMILGIINLMVDIKRPFFRWTHPQQVMKHNLNCLIGLGLNTLFLLVIGGLVYLLFKFGLSTTIVFTLLLLFFLIITFILYPRCVKETENAYNKNLEMR